MIELLDKHKARFIISVGSGKNRIRKTCTVEYTGKKDLKNKYDAFDREVRSQVGVSDITVNALVRSYIENRRMLGAKATTICGYEVALERLCGALDGILASSLTTYQLEDFVALMSQKYAQKTIVNTMSLLSSAYDRAIRTGQLADNPCKNVSMPKKKAKEIITFSSSEVFAFWKALCEERLDYKVGYGLCLLCGMRKSEVLGLKPSDIDLEKGFVRISHTRHYVNGKNVEQNTKTARSQRTLAVPQILIDSIRELIEEHEAFPYEQTEYLIQDGFGQPMQSATFTNHIKVIERRTGLPPVNVHGLRHTFATMLNSEGIDIARISAELGHSNVGTTLNVYTHVFGSATESSRAIADALNRKMSSSATNLPQ